jgi:hypothetical protein
MGETMDHPLITRIDYLRTLLELPEDRRGMSVAVALAVLRQEAVSAVETIERLELVRLRGLDDVHKLITELRADFERLAGINDTAAATIPPRPENRGDLRIEALPTTGASKTGDLRIEADDMAGFCIYIFGPSGEDGKACWGREGLPPELSRSYASRNEAALAIHAAGYRQRLVADF